MDRRDSVTAGELGTSAFGLSVNSMIGKFNELDRLQDLANSAEKDRELALRLQSENKDLREQIESLKKANGGSMRNYKMENIALRALQQKSNKTIAMLQERLKDRTDNLDDNAPIQAPIVVNDEWKLANRRTEMPPSPFPQMPGATGYQQPFQPYPNNNTSPYPLGAGGFVLPGSMPPGSPVPFNQQHMNNFNAYPTQYPPYPNQTEQSKSFFFFLASDFIFTFSLENNESNEHYKHLTPLPALKDTIPIKSSKCLFCIDTKKELTLLIIKRRR